MNAACETTATKGDKGKLSANTVETSSRMPWCSSCRFRANKLQMGEIAWVIFAVVVSLSLAERIHSIHQTTDTSETASEIEKHRIATATASFNRGDVDGRLEFDTLSNARIAPSLYQLPFIFVYSLFVCSIFSVDVFCFPFILTIFFSSFSLVPRLYNYISMRRYRYRYIYVFNSRSCFGTSTLLWNCDVSSIKYHPSVWFSSFCVRSWYFVDAVVIGLMPGKERMNIIWKFSHIENG